MGGAPEKKRREELGPMDQEIYDVTKELDPWNTNTMPEYLKRIKDIKAKYEAPPPVPPGLADQAIRDAGAFERQRRLGGSHRSSFLTGQGAAETFLTNPKTLLGGG